MSNERTESKERRDIMSGGPRGDVSQIKYFSAIVGGCLIRDFRKPVL